MREGDRDTFVEPNDLLNSPQSRSIDQPWNKTSKQADPSWPRTSRLRLWNLVYKHSRQNLFNQIFELTFIPRAGECGIDSFYNPPSCLSVNRATRKAFAKAFYGSTLFYTRYADVSKRLQSLQPDHVPMLSEIRIVDSLVLRNPDEDPRDNLDDNFFSRFNDAPENVWAGDPGLLALCFGGRYGHVKHRLDWLKVFKFLVVNEVTREETWMSKADVAAEPFPWSEHLA